MYRILLWTWAFVLTALSCSSAWAQPSITDPGFLVLPYLQFSTKNSMTVLWETTVAASTRVEFGEAQPKAESPNLSQQASLEGTRTMHEVVLADLKPETNYFWRVVSKTQAGIELKSPMYTFKTAVQDTTAYMFALVGDTQRNNDTPWGWQVVAKELWRHRPNFVVLAGDLVDWGPRKEDWTEHFFPGGQPLMSRVPLFSVLGNHEGDADYYYRYLANPTPEYYYSFTYGNAEFFMIDSNRDLSEGSEQYNWLDQALAKSTATWKIAIHHHPPYSSDSDDHGDTYKELSTLGTHARNLVPLYDKYKVDFCLFGHTHLYERSWPLRGDRINKKDGTIYINSGGAGGYTEAFAPTRSWFTLEQREGHHFCTFAIHENHLVFKAIDYAGHVFDAFELEKDTTRNAVSTLLSPPAPIIESEAFVFDQSTRVTIRSGIENLAVRYTLDGSEPASTSSLYTSPLAITKSCTLKTRAFTPDGRAGRLSQMAFQQTKPEAAASPKKKEAGLVYKYYEGSWRENKAAFFSLSNLKKQGITNTVHLSQFEPHQVPYFGVEFEGYLEVTETGSYLFYGLDARGLTVWLNDRVLIASEDDKQTLAPVVLEKGLHKIRIQSYQETHRKSLGFGLYSPTLGRMPIQPGMWWH